MTAVDPFERVDAEEVIDIAVRRYWQAEIDRGNETIPFDSLDPKRQMDLTTMFVKIAPHVIRSLREAMMERKKVEIPDVIPDYFFNEGTA